MIRKNNNLYSTLAKKVTDLGFFVKFFFLLIFICALLFIVLISITIFSSKIFSHTICLQKECIFFFLETFEIPLGFLYFSAKLLTIVVNIFGVFIAVHTYKENSKSNLLSTHLAHYNNFHSYVVHVIDSFPTLNNDIVDVYFLYNYIFPKSINGDYSVSEKYKNFISKMNNQINKYNNQRNARVEVIQPFSKLQKEIVDLFKEININLPFKPNQSDFHQIESDLYNLFSLINRSFISDDRLEIVEVEYF